MDNINQIFYETTSAYKKYLEKIGFDGHLKNSLISDPEETKAKEYELAKKIMERITKFGSSDYQMNFTDRTKIIKAHEYFLNTLAEKKK